ncbi:MAG: tetratricopeptide repeat protein [Chloroflexi bacterium]|nr:tetratricopeptide repeat protein [Chloroflexota bacterium]
MSDPNLQQQAIDALNSGNRDTAARLLAKVVAQDPRDEAAWLWLAACLDDVDKKRYCLHKVLEINPENETVRMDLSRLETNPPAPTPAAGVINLTDVGQEPSPAMEGSSMRMPASQPETVPSTAAPTDAEEKLAKPPRKTRFTPLQMIILVVLALAVVAAITVLYLLLTNFSL